MLVMVNVCVQTVPCGTSPKLWVTTGGAAWSRFSPMSGRKNLLAHGAGGPGGLTAGCPPAGAASPIATATSSEGAILRFASVRCDPRPRPPGVPSYASAASGVGGF